MSGFRVGQGFDVHRTRAGCRLWLCGVAIDSTVGLEGYSDADVALHAVVDAVLGAAAAGDLGEHFPPTDERWRDAESSELVRTAVAMVRDRGFEIVNCDITIIGERPRIAPHRQAMRRSLAALLRLPIDAVSVKATTTEGLGFAGRGEGLAASAVVLLAGAPENDA
jgi:2-C-methyl-D-erythritol 4-phosphate cytidylyltransferase/2-C-methyl-D-erythritol 2,4-cyclodiphosphate synthase